MDFHSNTNIVHFHNFVTMRNIECSSIGNQNHTGRAVPRTFVINIFKFKCYWNLKLKPGRKWCWIKMRLKSAQVERRECRVKKGCWLIECVIWNENEKRKTRASNFRVHYKKKIVYLFLFEYNTSTHTYISAMIRMPYSRQTHMFVYVEIICALYFVYCNMKRFHFRPEPPFVSIKKTL